MEQLQLTIKAESPLAIGSKKPGSVSEAADYIPGSVLRGALAGQLLRLAGTNPQANDDFSRLFVQEDAAIFRNAYPTKRGLPVKVLPSTAVSAKLKPGFKSKGEGVFDTLIDRFCAEHWQQLYNPTTLMGDRVEPYRGFYTYQKSNPKDIYESHSVSKRLLTRVGINRRRSTSEEQILYSLEVMNETYNQDGKFDQTIFTSTIGLTDATLAQHLAQFIQRSDKQIRLGGATSRGLGHVSLEIKEVKMTNFQSTLKANIEKFDRALKARWQKWEALYGKFYQPDISLSSRVFFTLNLQSDAILTAQWQRTTIISPIALCQLTGINDASLRLETAYSSYDYASGWNAAWGLMKDIELITNMGGVYLFSTENIDAWYSALEKLEYQGIGARTQEGFGQIKVCDTFHTIFQEEPV